ncbi:hypothetical protein LR48_Vigan10g175400 [Vigna angularis]|uniref:Uncharacterized protein n=1 Tax=Phaseolus angularis TaxID=3914 RepID=A0A0L9VLS8_PHAAN|nr:hypothetical protein LR48_Vigan10g175400 [Vigna angularis]
MASKSSNTFTTGHLAKYGTKFLGFADSQPTIRPPKATTCRPILATGTRPPEASAVRPYDSNVWSFGLTGSTARSPGPHIRSSINLVVQPFVHSFRPFGLTCIRQFGLPCIRFGRSYLLVFGRSTSTVRPSVASTFRYSTVRPHKNWIVRPLGYLAFRPLSSVLHGVKYSSIQQFGRTNFVY